MYELSDKPKLACPLVDDPEFKYVPAASTDVAATLRRFGFIPPSTLKDSK